MKSLASATFILITAIFGCGQTSNTQSSQSIRQVNLKDAAYRDAVSTLSEDWYGADWAQESNIQEFQIRTVFGDMTGDGVEEAAVHVTYTMGGSGSANRVFVYTLNDSEPVLIGTVKGGDRAHGGIKSVRIINRKLLVETYGPNAQDCNACYGSIAVTGYEYLGERLVNVGLMSAKPYPSEKATRSRHRRNR